MGFVYSPKNGFEFYLNVPREIRHPDEYGNISQEDINMFNNITSGMMDIASKVEAMGFKTSLNSTPEGYKGSLNEEFQVGDKVTYLGHPAVVTATKEYNGRDFVSVDYDKGTGKTKASMILVKSGDVKAVEEGTCGYTPDGEPRSKPAGPVDEESDTDVGGGAKQAIGLDIDDEGASDAALDSEVNKMGYAESKEFNFKKMIKEALTPNYLK